MDRTLLALGLALLALSASPDAAAQVEVPVQEIGRYRLAPGVQGLELRRASGGRAVGAAALAGFLLLFAAGALASRGVAPVGVVAGIGAALLAFAVWSALDRAVWHANSATLVREGFAGRSQSWPVAEIDALEVQERRPTGAEKKRSGAEPWEVRVRLRNGSSVGPSLRAQQRADALALAGALAEALGKPLRQEGGAGGSDSGLPGAQPSTSRPSSDAP